MGNSNGHKNGNGNGGKEPLLSPQLDAALLTEGDSAHRVGAEDEAIKDLRKEIRKVSVSSNAPPTRAQSDDWIGNQRNKEDLLHPELGRALQDVAKPGGFRRHHVKQVKSSTREYVHTSLLQILQPSIAFRVLAVLQEEDEKESIAGGNAPDAHAVAAESSASNLAVCIIIIKCCFGSAFLIVPNGYKTAGWIGAPLLLIVVYLLMMVGMLNLIEARKAFTNGPARFQDIGRVFGSWGPAYLSIAGCLLVYGFNCIWCVTCAQNIGMDVPSWSGTERLFVFAPPVALLSLTRHLKYFTMPLFMGILGCASTCVYLGYFACQEISANGTKQIRPINTTDADSLLWLGACGYIFELIMQIIPIYEAAADKESMPKLLVGCTCGVIVLYLSFGFLFYVAFGDETKDLATLNLPKGSFAGKLFPFLFSLVGVVTMPINFFIIYQAYEPKLAWSDDLSTRRWMKNFVRVIVVAWTYFTTWLGGSQLQNFLAVVGGLLGANVSMVVPCAIHLLVCKQTGLSRFLNWTVIVAGFLMMILSTYQAVMTWK